MPSVFSNILPFRVDLILGNKNKSGGNKSGEYVRDLILESLVLSKTVLLIPIPQCEVSRCHARGTIFLFPEIEILLVEFFEPNKTIFLFHHTKSHLTIS
jgi:hypothetical protein